MQALTHPFIEKYTFSENIDEQDNEDAEDKEEENKQQIINNLSYQLFFRLK